MAVWKPTSLAVALMIGLASEAWAQDANTGATVFRKKCMQCHTIESGRHGPGGPSLFGVYGRQAGATDFKRYRGLKDADIVWDEALLDAFIANPITFVRAHTQNERTRMTFKLPDPQERGDVIAYLKTLK